MTLGVKNWLCKLNMPKFDYYDPVVLQGIKKSFEGAHSMKFYNRYHASAHGTIIHVSVGHVTGPMEPF